MVRAYPANCPRRAPYDHLGHDQGGPPRPDQAIVCSSSFRRVLTPPLGAGNQGRFSGLIGERSPLFFERSTAPRPGKSLRISMGGPLRSPADIRAKGHVILTAPHGGGARCHTVELLSPVGVGPQTYEAFLQGWGWG